MVRYKFSNFLYKCILQYRKSNWNTVTTDSYPIHPFLTLISITSRVTVFPIVGITPPSRLLVGSGVRYQMKFTTTPESLRRSKLQGCRKMRVISYRWDGPGWNGLTDVRNVMFEWWEPDSAKTTLKFTLSCRPCTLRYVQVISTSNCQTLTSTRYFLNEELSGLSNSIPHADCGIFCNKLSCHSQLHLKTSQG